MKRWIHVGCAIAMLVIAGVSHAAVPTVEWDITTNEDLAVVRGTVVHVTGRVRPRDRGLGKIRSLDLRIDKRVIGTVSWDNANFQIDTAKLGLGRHLVDLLAHPSDEGKTYADHASAVLVLDQAPCSLEGVTANATLIDPSLKLRLKVAPAGPYFRMNAAAYLLDGKSIGESTKAPYDLEYDLRSLDPGTHELRAIAYDRPRKLRFEMKPVLCAIPERIVLESPRDGDLVEVSDKVRSITLKASWPTGMQVSAMTFLCNDEVVKSVAPAAGASSESFDYDLEQQDPGDYRFAVAIVCPSHDRKYSSPTVTVTVHNNPLLAARVKAEEDAEKKAEADTAEADRLAQQKYIDGLLAARKPRTIAAGEFATFITPLDIAPADSPLAVWVQFVSTDLSQSTEEKTHTWRIEMVAVNRAQEPVRISEVTLHGDEYTSLKLKPGLTDPEKTAPIPMPAGSEYHLPPNTVGKVFFYAECTEGVLKKLLRIRVTVEGLDSKQTAIIDLPIPPP